jgi:hypothetical protein
MFMLFINMIRNNLNRKENLKRANEFVKSIKKFPVSLIRASFEFNALESKVEEIKKETIEFLFKKSVEMTKKILGKKIKIVVYPLLVWDNENHIHQITIRIIIVGDIKLDKAKKLYDELWKLNNETFDDQLKLRLIGENTLEDVFIEIFPVQFDEYLTDLETFQIHNYFPKFYSRDLFSFLTSPLKIY